jgi:streptogramin lyase
VAAAVAALLLSGRSAAEPLRQDSVVELRGSAMQRGDAFRVGRSPRAVATDSAGRLWVANFADETVVRIDPRSGQATSFGVGEAPTALAVGDGGVWVGSSFGRALVRLGATKAASALPFPADGLAFGRGSVWSVNQRAGTLVATDPDSLASRVVLRGLKGPSAVAFADGVLWIPESFARRLLRVDPETGRVNRFRLPLAPESVAVGCGAVWLTNPAADEVTEWRLRDHFPRLIAVGFSPTSVAVGSKTAWVVNDIAHSVEAIDCTTATPVRTLTLGRNGVAGPKLTPGGVGASGDTAWVAIDGF